MKPLRPLQEMQGYVSIYAVMERFGYLQTCRAWRKLLFQHHQTLPQIKLRQFLGQDGRKGKYIPAVHLRDLDLLIQHFDAIQWQEDPVTFVRPAVEHVLQVVAVAFQDHLPEAQMDVDGMHLDLHLRSARLALVYRPTGPLDTPSPMQVVLESGLRVLSFDPEQEDFKLGKLIFELRQHLEGKEG